jgi:hypothetical protein
LFFTAEPAPKLAARQACVAFPLGQRRHPAQLLPNGLLALRRLFRETIDGVANRVLAIRRQLMQTVVQIPERLLLLRWKPVEPPQPLL